MKQKYLSRAPTSASTTPTSTPTPSVPVTTTNRDSPVTPTSSPRPPFQSRFLGAGKQEEKILIIYLCAQVN